MYGPALVVVALLVVGVAAAAWWLIRRRASAAVLVVAVLASIGSSSPVGTHVSAAVRAGASVDLLRAASVTGAPSRPWTGAPCTPRPQVACALGRIAEDARGLGGDPRHVVLAGGSAGGQLAVSVAYRAATGSQEPSCGRPVRCREPSRRCTPSSTYPALDPVDGYEHGGHYPCPGSTRAIGRAAVRRPRLRHRPRVARAAGIGLDPDALITARMS